MIIPQNVKLRRNPPSYEIVCNRLIELKKALVERSETQQSFIVVGLLLQVLDTSARSNYSYCTILAVSVSV